MISTQRNTSIEKIKRLLKIEHGEGKPLVYFLMIFALLGIGSAIGKASADALFLKRYGVEHLPTMYILLSVSMAFFSAMYAAFVDRISPERFFKLILLILTVTLACFWAVITFTELEEIFPAYYLLYKIISEIIVVHAAFYLDKNLDTMQSKRLTPIILAGYQTGMITGGVILATFTPWLGVENAPLFWLFFTLISVAVIFTWHRSRGSSPFYIPPSKSNRNKIICAIDEIRHGVGFIKKSPLLRDLSFALFFMVIAYYILSFSANSIYATVFTDEARLTAFLGWLVAGTNLLALFLQIFIANRTLEKLGVRKTKYIYPITMLGSFIALIAHPGLFSAIAANISRESIMPAFRNPSRQMYFSVLPDYMKGRARATAVVLVMPVALLTCGILLTILNTLDVNFIYGLGLASTIAYLFFCYCMGKNYIGTLISNMRERLFIPQGSSIEAYRGNDQAFHDSLLQGLASDDDAVSLSYARLLITNYRDQSIDPILERIDQAEDKYADQMLCLLGDNISGSRSKQILTFSEKKDDHFKATALNIILRSPKTDNTFLLDECFLSDSPRIRATAIRSVIKNNLTSHAEPAYNHWLKLLGGDINSKTAALDLISLLDDYDDRLLIDSYKTIITELQNRDDDDFKFKLYNSLKHWHHGKLPECNHGIILDINHHNQRVRAAAIQCLFICGSMKNIESYLINALDDGHPSVRAAAIDLIRRHAENPLELYLQWTEINVGTPRAQKEIAQQLISSGVDTSLLKNMADAKIGHALKFFEASQVLAHTDQKSIEVNLLNIAMRERSEQMIDLVLMLLHPLVDNGILSVIRAGLLSKDKSHIANAREALQEINDRQIVMQLNTLIEKHGKIDSDNVDDLSKATANEVITWCTNINDHWLQFCGRCALTKLSSEQA